VRRYIKAKMLGHKGFVAVKRVRADRVSPVRLGGLCPAARFCMLESVCLSRSWRIMPAT